MHGKESLSVGEGLLASTSGNVGSNGDATGSADPNAEKFGAAKVGLIWLLLREAFHAINDPIFIERKQSFSGCPIY